MSFIHPRGVRFQCLRCAQCCGDTGLHVRHVLMLEIEAQRIAKLISKPVKDFAIDIRGREPYVYEIQKRSEDGKCVFLEGHSCSVYEHRPVVCRFYPFEFRRAENGVGEFHPTSECLGIGKGRFMRRSLFQGLLRQFDEASRPDSV